MIASEYYSRLAPGVPKKTEPLENVQKISNSKALAKTFLTCFPKIVMRFLSKFEEFLSIYWNYMTPAVAKNQSELRF